MKTASERIWARLKKDRQMTVISMRIPEDVIEDLKEIASLSGILQAIKPLIRAYSIGQRASPRPGADGEALAVAGADRESAQARHRGWRDLSGNCGGAGGWKV